MKPSPTTPSFIPTLAPSRSVFFDRRQIRTLADRFARSVITVGGLGLILCILGMFVFLVKEILPLFQEPEAALTESLDLLPPQGQSSSVAIVGVDEHQQLAYVLRGNVLDFVTLGGPTPVISTSQSLLAEDSVTAWARALGRDHRLVVGTSHGRAVPVAIEFHEEYSSNTRAISPSVTVEEPIVIGSAHRQITNLAYQRTDSDTRIAALLEDQHLWLTTNRITLRPDGNALTSQKQVDLTSQIQGRVTALTFGSQADVLAVGTDKGLLYQFDVGESDQPILVETKAVSPDGVAVTALSYLIGDRSLVVGDASGQVSVWLPVRQHSDSNLTQIRAVHRLDSHAKAVTGITVSQRDKGFLTTDASGEIWLHHSTSEQTLLRLHPVQGTTRSIYFSPKADGLVSLTDTDRLIHYRITNPHPEITWRSLFYPVWYEGYDRPEYVWQSSSGSDDFEPKFSLTPLIFGTIKGTIYALLLALPLAVLAAIYTAMFMHPNLRAKLKPTIEIMAALPTVVLGFLAGLWFAPVVERYFPAMTAMTFTIPITIVGSAALFLLLPASVRHRVRPGAEALLLMPIIIGVVWWCLANNGWWESILFEGRYKLWLETNLGLRYDQRNGVVVGLAMGFAIIPIIYSISEEAISNVPKNLIAGSLALGATRWQTLTHLVLVSASPGIFSALMIGLGRAIGETMIVLMATGNTPIMDWSLFNGFRTLSANIAVEIPEAPHGGTLYRTLFLAGLLLFVVTFAVNTGAELIRQRLRDKYSQF